MSIQKQALSDVGRNVKYGALAGHIAAWSIFGLIFLVDGRMGWEAGTFYSTIGLALGAGIAFAAFLGFILHMITGTVIGLLFGYITTVVRAFNMTSVSKAFGLAILTGFISWLVLFLPITTYVVQPALPEIAAILEQPRLLEVGSEILGGAAGMHLIYGGIFGLMYYLAVVPSPRDYET